MSHINILELKAAFLALQTFAAQFSNCHILLLIDNTMAIAYINHKAGMHFSGIVKPKNRNVGVVLGRNLSIHISGWENVSVDMESRRSLDPSNWFLNRTIFKYFTRSQMGTIRRGPFLRLVITSS